MNALNIAAALCPTAPAMVSGGGLELRVASDIAAAWEWGEIVPLETLARNIDASDELHPNASPDASEISFLGRRAAMALFFRNLRVSKDTADDA